jgi:glutamine synthetase type III
MSDLQQTGDELTHLNSGYDQAKPEGHKFSEIFGENIFSLNNLKEYVTESTYEKLKV